MSASILHFTRREELSARGNMNEFINACRASAVLNASSQFDKNVWLEGYRKGKTSMHRIVFSTIEAVSQPKPLATPSFDEPFLSLAKACIVYLQDRRPVVSNGPRISALRCLDAALRTQGLGGQPTAINGFVLDAALEIASARLTPSVAYRVAGQLELLADVLSEVGVIRLPGRWLHGLKKPKEGGSRISMEAIQARQEKLPSAAVIRAIGSIYSEAAGVDDTIVTAYCALMLCAPQRVNEVVRLDIHCLVKGEGHFEGKLGIRWPGSKLALDTTKWLPSHMVTLAREAIGRLRTTSAAARRVAAWYAKNPANIYLDQDAEHLRMQDLITAHDVAAILWGEEKSKGSTRKWLQANHIQPTGAFGRTLRYRFSDVEAAVLRLLPATFPIVPGTEALYCEDALGLCLLNELQSKKATFRCMFQTISQGHIYSRLGSRSGMLSIFDRYGHTEDDGSPIQVTSHAFRHYLNTLAQLGGLSDTEISIFSGRKDVRQNRAYDHRTSEEIQAPLITATQKGFRGELVAKVHRDLITRDELLASGKPVSHSTQFGYCMHDFAAEPCLLYRDCLNCDEQECVKGERHKEDNLRRTRAETEQALARAKAALADEEYGADLWVQHHIKTLARIDELLALLENPALPNGTRIRVSDRSEAHPRLGDIGTGRLDCIRPVVASPRVKRLLR